MKGYSLKMEQMFKDAPIWLYSCIEGEHDYFIRDLSKLHSNAYSPKCSSQCDKDQSYKKLKDWLEDS